jgi:predicted methyltransferase
MKRSIIAAASVLALFVAACASAPPPQKPGLAADAYAAILADPGRPEADRKDDEARKPAEVLAFADIRPGDTVLELEAGRGWYSELISGAVGPTGKLIAQYPPEFAYGDAAFKARTDAGRLKNTELLKSHFDDLQQVASGSVDRVLWVLGPHELYYTPPNSRGLGNDEKTYAEIMRVLKPGGLFIAMDHAADPGASVTIAQTLHRIDPSVVVSAAQSAGFKMLGRSEVLANPADDRHVMVFDATIRRHTDQFLFKFQKKN